MQSDFIKKYKKDLNIISGFFEAGDIDSSKTTYLPEAIANHNFKVITNQGTFIIKILINETGLQVENHIAIRDQLNQVGLKTSTLLEGKDGKSIYKNQELLATMSPIIEGIYPPQIDEKLCFELGNAIALFHSAVKRIPNNNIGWLNPKRLKTIKTKGNLAIKQAIDLATSELRIYKLGLPTGIIHGDLFDTNLFVDPNNIYRITTIFDFEESESNILLVDLARSILANCEEDNGLSLNKELLSKMVQGYNSVRKLTQIENTSLPSVINYVAGMSAIWFESNGFEEFAKRTISKARSF